MPLSRITWQAHEFEYRTKDVSWYWISIVIATVLVGFAVWQRNFLFGFFVVIAEILVLVWAEKSPRLVTFELTPEGLGIVGEKTYLYRDLEAFSIEENSRGEWSHGTLYFQHKLKPALTITFPGNRQNDIEEMLAEFLPKREWEESFLENLQKFLRF